MFEKEAEEATLDLYGSADDVYGKEDYKQGFKDGAEFGCNKAKEEVKAPYPSYEHLFGESIEPDSVEVVRLKNQIFIARGLLENWYNQHSDKGYTETFYNALIKATEEFLWSDVCVK